MQEVGGHGHCAKISGKANIRAKKADTFNKSIFNGHAKSHGEGRGIYTYRFGLI